MNAPAESIRETRWPQPGKLWSLWDMLKLGIGGLLELHEVLVIEKGHFESAHRNLEQRGSGQILFERHHFLRLRSTVAEVAKIATDAGLSCTSQAASRTDQFLGQRGDIPEGADLAMNAEHCGNAFRHLLDICSRIRDECASRIYFQIDPASTALLELNAQHFGPEVEAAFPPANEDIAEAASCLALGRTTASIFHLMRAMEAAVFVVAGHLEVERLDKKGGHRAWGQLLPAIKSAIDAIPTQSTKDKWAKAHALLWAVNRAWRVEVSHGSSELRPKKTYTEQEATTCFQSVKAFMQYMAELLAKSAAAMPSS